jgi:hypothetical protein
MTPRNLLCLALLATAHLAAQTTTVYPVAAPPPDQLEPLVSPIALYPDPLISIILPASTVPGDVTLAARYTRGGGDPGQIDNQPWDESVRALAHYPELIGWMDDNLEWTKQLGGAFVAEPADVMNTIQSLRQRARDAGILVDTPQQQVVVQQNYIYIEPAQPDVIYVPTYDPQIFYQNGYARSGLSFGLAFSTGPWLAFEPDWRQRSIAIDRRRAYDRRGVWNPPNPNQLHFSLDRQTWHPRTDVVTRQREYRSSPVVTLPRADYRVAQPAPLPEARTPAARSGWSRSNVATAPSENRLPPTGRDTPISAYPRQEATTPPATQPGTESRRDGFRRPTVENQNRIYYPAPNNAAQPAPKAEQSPQALPQHPAVQLPPQARPNEAPPQTAPHGRGRSDEPSPKGRAKGHDRDDDDDHPGRGH